MVSWPGELERLAEDIRSGRFSDAASAAQRLQREKDPKDRWPPADLSRVRLYVFEAAPEAVSNPKLGKWTDSLNRLMHKLLEGDFQEIARVTGIMKKYGASYTLQVDSKEVAARELPGLTCHLSHPPSNG